MKIIINSHIKSNISLQHLLEGLKENDINTFSVIVVIGGYYNLDNYKIIDHIGNLITVLGFATPGSYLTVQSNMVRKNKT